MKIEKHYFVVSLILILVSTAVVSCVRSSQEAQVEALDMSSDGATLAVSVMRYRNALSPVPEIVDVRRLIRLYELSTWKYRDIEIHAVAEAIAFSPDGNLLATGHRDGLIMLWDVENEQVVKTLKGHTDPIWSLDFSLDNAYLTSAGTADGTAKVWALPSGELIATIKQEDWVTSVSFSPDSQYLATGSRDGNVRIWDFIKGELFTTLVAHTDGVIDVSFSHDGKLLASGGWDDVVAIWDFTAKKLKHRLSEFASDVTVVTFSPDDTLIAAGSGFPEFVVKLWDPRNGKMITSLKGHTGRLESIVFSVDGDHIFTGGSHGGNFIAGGDADGSIRVWEAATGKEKKRIYP